MPEQHTYNGYSLEALIEAAVDAAHGGTPLADAHHGGLLQAIAEQALPGQVEDDHEFPDVPLVDATWLLRWDEDQRQNLRSILANGAGDGPWFWFRLGEILSQGRLQELVAGADPTPEEMLDFAHLVFNELQEDTDLADVSWGYSPYRLTTRDGRHAWLAYFVRGYSFSGLDEELEGPFLTKAQLLAAIRDRGYRFADEITLEDAKAMLGLRRRGEAALNESR